MAKKKSPKAHGATIESLDVTALVARPRHLVAIGTLTVEITHLERAISEMFSAIMGIHFFLGEAIYFTVNSGIARMDIVRNAAPLVLFKFPDDLKTVNKFIERAKAVMGKRHAVIHSFWMLSEKGEDIAREKLGEFRNTIMTVVTLTELNNQIEDVQRLTNEIYGYCNQFKKDHPKKIGALKDYW